MTKKTDIGSKAFSDLLLPLPYRPSHNLVKRIDSKFFSLDNNPIFSYKPEQLAFQEYKRCLDLFQRRNPGLKPEEAIHRVGGVQKFITEAEAPIRKELEEICVSTLKEIYQVPDFINLKAFIQPRLDFDSSQETNPSPFLELSLEEKNQMREAIRLRECHVSLIHGSSMHSWKGIYHLASDEINKLNPSLMELYDYYTSIIGIALWHINPDTFQQEIENNTQMTQGYSEVQSNRQRGFGATIKAKGINFPTLIHECNKGLMSHLFHAGIPQNYNETQLDYFYSIADNIQNEPFHYLFGPTLWSGLLETAQVPNGKIPDLISNLVKLNFQQTVELFHLIQDNKEQAIKIIKKWNL